MTEELKHDPANPQTFEGETEQTEPAYDDVEMTRMMVGGAAWLVAYAVARRHTADPMFAAMEADKVADHFAQRFGVRK